VKYILLQVARSIKRIFYISRKIQWCTIYNSLFALIIKLRKKEFKSNAKRIILISYPRSGCNWIRYVTEFLSKKRTPGHFRLIIGGKAAAFNRVHAWRAADSFKSYEKAILLIRNYKECLIRHHPEEFKKSESVKQFFASGCIQPPIWYILNIKNFDLFKGKKLLIYYEDLIKDPKMELSKIIDFLELKVPHKRQKSFFGNLDYHKNKSMKLYSLNERSDTNGDLNKVIYHSKKLTDEQKEDFDDFLQNNYHALYSRYLRRYRSRKT